LLDLLAHLEAGLDFVEEDVEFISAVELDRQLASAADAVHAAAGQMTARGETPDAWRVALAGWPNVGKSSLLNALAGESAALVAETPGTTRDYLRRRVAWDHFHVELLDTAGVEPAAGDAISAAAQSMSDEQVAKAHLVLLCLDVSRPLNHGEDRQLAEHYRLRSADRGLGTHECLNPQSAIRNPQSAPRLVVLTKTDLPRCVDVPFPHVAVSSITGAGLDELRRRIEETIAEQYQETAVVAGTAIRCRESLRLASESLVRARQAAIHQIGEELVAAEIRTALDELGKVAGQIYTDDVLDRIFSRFCIGK
jgi:tRNA modification GTPase